jgi:hypothetical protein
MESSFTWLDYSEHERRQMLDVIELFAEPGTRDELGIGGVRDGFADLLFPGINTIQTRAKYFLFVPWIYSMLERKFVPSAAIEKRARKHETELVYAIEGSDDNSGLIGRRAKENLQRPASDIYWMGLGVWGIRSFYGSQDQYHRSLDQFYIRRDGRTKRPKDFKDETWPEAALLNWDSGLPPAPDGFLQEASFELSVEEAKYLSERAINSRPKSLSAFILRERIPIDDVDACWHFADKCPSELRDVLKHGQNFSEVMLGAQLLYNLMLAKKLSDLRPMLDTPAGLIDKYTARMREWWAAIAARRANLDSWDRQRFWEIVRQGNPRVSVPARSFIDSWIGLVQKAMNLDGLIQDVAAQNLISSRELCLKKGLARLHNPRPLELWNGASGDAQMDLRWFAARGILADILTGLEETADA